MPIGGRIIHHLPGWITRDCPGGDREGENQGGLLLYKGLLLLLPGLFPSYFSLLFSMVFIISATTILMIRITPNAISAIRIYVSILFSEF
jgi:hypothetical protein